MTPKEKAADAENFIEEPLAESDDDQNSGVEITPEDIWRVAKLFQVTDDELRSQTPDDAPTSDGRMSRVVIWKDAESTMQPADYVEAFPQLKAFSLKEIKTFADALEKSAIEFAEQAPVIRAKYGEWLTEHEINAIILAEKEMSYCKDCKGLPCQKPRNKHFTPVIQSNATIKLLNVPVARCKFFAVELKKRALKILFKNGDIPAQYQNLTFGDYVEDENNRMAIRVAKALIKNLDKGAFFYGDYGTGKTMLAAITAQEHIALGRPALFSRLPDVLRAVRETYRQDSKHSDAEILKELYEVPALVLDDVKATRQKKFAGEVLFDIIDTRYNARLQTIMTSNDTLEDLANALDNPLDGKSNDGSRIYDRCKEMCYPVRLGGKSRRG